MILEKLLNGTENKLIKGSLNTEITGLEIDSRKVKPGDAFICISGAKTDGHNYIKNAIENGASTIIVEKEVEVPEDVTVIKCESTQNDLSLLASNFYDNPQEDLTIIAITGTKGKTTTTQMIANVLNAAGYPTGTIGSLGINYSDIHIDTPNTTPDGLVLNKTFRDMVNKGIKYVVMEASSQGFKLKRTDGLKFDIGIFLNIDQDHIGENEHENFEDYLNSKKKIIPQSKVLIINKDSSIYKDLESKENIITFSSFTDKDSDYFPNAIKLYNSEDDIGISFELNTTGEEFELIIPGKFNIDNSLAAIASLDQLDIDHNIIKKVLANFQPNGRSQLIKKALPLGRVVYIDFAHNRLSMENMLKSLREYNPKKIISLIGLHPEETKLRRWDVGYSSGKNADFTIYTSDYMGISDFDEVAKDVEEALIAAGGDYIIIPDRKEAIEYALNITDLEDIIVLFGMGDVKYQLVDGNEVDFDEEEIVVNYLQHLKDKT